MRSFYLAVVVFGSLSATAAFAQTPGAGAPGASAGSAAAPAGAPTSATPPPPSTATGAPASPAAKAAPPAPPPPPAPPAAAPATPPTPAATTSPAQSLEPTKTVEPPKPMAGTTAGTALGLPPSAPTVAGGTNLTTQQAESLTSSTSGSADEWKFDFHGYMRAPFRISFGQPTPVVFPSIYNQPTGDPRPAGTYYNPTTQMPPAALPGTQWHSPPRVPGYLYTTWEFINTVGGPWAQLNFSYGNSRAMATVIVDSYAQTDGGYRHLQAQQGIDQAFLTLNFPEALGDLGTLTWNIGSFQNRYGTMGKYDGGMYETYIFGRTHMSGETLTANLTNVDSAGDWAITLEHGLGAKIEIVPFLNNANYQVFQNVPVGSTAGSPYTSDRSPDYLPYAGSVPQGSTFVHHAHIGAKYQKMWTFGLHYLFTWTPDDNWHPINSTLENASDQVPRANGPIQGSMQITGAEVRFAGGVYGDGYAAYSHIDARNINALADSIEVMHSYGGYQFKQNFFGKTFNGATGDYQGPQNETGTVDNIAAQYSFSLGQLNRYPEEFWGDGPDLVFTGFGILSIVDSKAPPAPSLANGRADWDMSTKKLKFGGDAIYTPLYWLGLGVRYDNVQPDLDGKYARPGTTNPGGSELNFQSLNLRAVFRTQFVTHEAVTLRYAHYFLGEQARAPYPYDWIPKADPNLVSLDATMWW